MNKDLRSKAKRAKPWGKNQAIACPSTPNSRDHNIRDILFWGPIFSVHPEAMEGNCHKHVGLKEEK
jgi:hypothetical protein